MLNTDVIHWCRGSFADIRICPVGRLPDYLARWSVPRPFQTHLCLLIRGIHDTCRDCAAAFRNVHSVNRLMSCFTLVTQILPGIFSCLMSRYLRHILSFLSIEPLRGTACRAHIFRTGNLRQWHLQSPSPKHAVLVRRNYDKQRQFGEIRDAVRQVNRRINIFQFQCFTYSHGSGNCRQVLGAS